MASVFRRPNELMDGEKVGDAGHARGLGIHFGSKKLGGPIGRDLKGHGQEGSREIDRSWRNGRGIVGSRGAGEKYIAIVIDGHAGGNVIAIAGEIRRIRK